MERQPELVAAAEALHAWILTQRASWQDVAHLDDVSLDADAIDDLDLLAEPARVASPPPTPVFTPVAPLPADRTADLLLEPPDVAPPAAATTVLPFDSAEPAAEEPEPRRRIEIPWATLSRLGVRAAALFVIATLLGASVAGGRLLWTRYASTPRVGTVVFESVPGDAEVLIDGKVAGRTPLQRDLPVGRHAIEFRRQRATRTMNVEVVRGTSTTSRVDWSPRRVGALLVESTPAGAKVTVDGKAQGVTPVTLDDLSVGAHSVVIESSAGTVRRRVQIVAGQTEVLSESIFPGWLRVSAPVEVSVSEDGRGLQLDTSRRVLMSPGRHTVVLENRALGIAERREVDIEPGATATVSLEAAESSLTVTSTVPADVAIDGVPVGPTPVTQTGVRVGTHEITAVDASGDTRRRTVRVTAKPTEVHIDFSTQ
jgi:hypothetical protein